MNTTNLKNLADTWLQSLPAAQLESTNPADLLQALRVHQAAILRTVGQALHAGYMDLLLEHFDWSRCYEARERALASDLLQDLVPDQYQGMTANERHVGAMEMGTCMATLWQANGIPAEGCKTPDQVASPTPRISPYYPNSQLQRRAGLRVRTKTNRELRVHRPHDGWLLPPRRTS